jgi:hypothetical protein
MMRAAQLVARIQQWQQDDAAGDDDALALLHDAVEVLTETVLVERALQAEIERLIERLTAKRDEQEIR